MSPCLTSPRWSQRCSTAESRLDLWSRCLRSSSPVSDSKNGTIQELHQQGQFDGFTVACCNVNELENQQPLACLENRSENDDARNRLWSSEHYGESPGTWYVTHHGLLRWWCGISIKCLWDSSAPRLSTPSECGVFLHGRLVKSSSETVISTFIIYKPLLQHGTFQEMDYGHLGDLCFRIKLKFIKHKSVVFDGAAQDPLTILCIFSFN